MKATIKERDLKRLLAAVGHIGPFDSALGLFKEDVFDGVHLTVEDDFSVMAFDKLRTVWVESSCPLSPENNIPGTVVVSFSLLRRLVDSAPTASYITLERRGTILEISVAGMQTSIPVVNGYIDRPVVTPTRYVTLHTATLLYAIRRMMKFTSDRKELYKYFELKTNGIAFSLTGMDGCRAATYETEWPGVEIPPISCLIRAELLLVAIKAIHDMGKEELDLEFAGNTTIMWTRANFCETENQTRVVVTSDRIDDFLPVIDMFGPETEYDVTVYDDVLRSSLLWCEIAKPFSVTMFSTEEGQLKLMSATAETIRVNAVINATMHTEHRVDTVFDVEYLLDALAGYDGPVEIQARGQRAPILLRTQHMRYIIMPIQTMR